MSINLQIWKNKTQDANLSFDSISRIFVIDGERRSRLWPGEVAARWRRGGRRHAHKHLGRPTHQASRLIALIAQINLRPGGQRVEFGWCEMVQPLRCPSTHETITISNQQLVCTGVFVRALDQLLSAGSDLTVQSKHFNRCAMSFG